MYGYVAGYSDTSVINYCPACGERISETFADGTGKCPECGMRFGIIEIDEESEVIIGNIFDNPELLEESE